MYKNTVLTLIKRLSIGEAGKTLSLHHTLVDRIRDSNTTHPPLGSSLTVPKNYFDNTNHMLKISDNILRLRYN